MYDDHQDGWLRLGQRYSRSTKTVEPDEVRDQRG
jgi:hypothetical protein